MPNRFSPIGPNATLQQVIAVMNANFAQLDQEAVSKVFTLSGGVNGMILGRLPGDQGMGLILNDSSGNPAIVIHVDKNGVPKIETYNQAGLNDLLIGRLPDGSSNFLVAGPGSNVADGIIP